MKRLAFFLQCLAIFILSGCFSTPDESNTSTAKAPTSNPSGKPANNSGGWDDFPNKYRPTLVDLDSNVRELPLPIGTRYSALNPGGQSNLNKTAANASCTGDSTVFSYQSRIRELFLYDTTYFYDSVGIAHCAAPGGSRAGEKHLRRIVEVGVGEAWETIRDSITDQDVLPRHTLHGTGSIRMERGIEITIQSYDLTLLTQFATTDAFVVDAGLDLLYKDGYAIHLGLANPHPYEATDFFPLDGPTGFNIIMSGPITHASAKGIDTAGYFDLFDDHTVHIRDWTGAPLKP
jgi:hypothetical protein